MTTDASYRETPIGTSTVVLFTGAPQMGKPEWQDKGAVVQTDKGHGARERRSEGGWQREENQTH